MYRFKAFTLDPQRRALLRDGSPIAITPKAFDILLYLVEHPNQVLTKQAIMKAVWSEAIVEEANLTVNMSLLRKALGERDDDRLIVTVPRQGYQFVAHVTTATASSSWPSVRAPRRSRGTVWGGLALAILLIGVTIAWTRLRREPVARVAVLPFDNLTGDTARNYLADGLTEELITHLARLDPTKLSVIARTSVMQYRRDSKRLDHIGRDLSVRYAIESSLQQSEGRLRVSVRLVQVADQRDLWAGDFDYGTQDVFHIEDSVGAAVARAVQMHVSPATPERTPDPVAVDAVMRGRVLYHYAVDKATWEAARQHFMFAISRDSGYAPAWAWLGATDRYGAGRAYISADSAIPAARAAIDRALALDPNLPEAWEARGQLERLVDWNWEAAAQSFRRELALDPGGTSAVAHNASMELTLGHFDKAIELQRRTVTLDPADPLERGQLATVEYYAGHLDEVAKIIDSMPRDVLDAVSKQELLDEYLALGRVARAEALVPLQAAAVERLRGRALVSYAEGERPASDSALAGLIAQYHEGAMYEIAEVYAFRGQADSALVWLDRGYAARDQGIAFVEVDPMFAKLRGDPRFDAFLTKMRLPH